MRKQATSGARRSLESHERQSASLFYFVGALKNDTQEASYEKFVIPCRCQRVRQSFPFKKMK